MLIYKCITDLLKMESEILRFTEKPVIDESVQEYEFHKYEPQARTYLNSPGEMNIELQDLITHPCENYLVFEGRLTKDNGNPYVNRDAVTLINNGIMYLFIEPGNRIGSSSWTVYCHAGIVKVL